MTYHYLPGAVRWKRYTGTQDIRCYWVAKGWDVFADLVDRHPITGRQLKNSQWWIREEFIGDEE